AYFKSASGLRRSGKESQSDSSYVCTKNNSRIPFNAVMSPFFHDMLDDVVGIGPSYKGPSYDKLRVHLLADLKRKCQMLVDSYRSAWRKIGCTLMADGWIDQRKRTLINFLVYCSRSLCFVKSIDASSMVKNASLLCHLFSKVIEWIGPNDVVHVVTDNAANYVATAYFLNPAFFFGENYKEAPDVMRGLLDLVTLYCKCNNLDSVEPMKKYMYIEIGRKASIDQKLFELQQNLSL
ncbi:hypothetical protein S245_045278, partial [Arachis hypogaea]